MTHLSDCAPFKPSCGLRGDSLADSSHYFWQKRHYDFNVRNYPQFVGENSIHRFIAGDGYFYIAYSYQQQSAVSQSTRVAGWGSCGPPPGTISTSSSNSTQTTDTVVHLMLIRVGSDGSSSKMDVKDWESKFMGQSSASETRIVSCRLLQSFQLVLGISLHRRFTDAPRKIEPGGVSGGVAGPRRSTCRWTTLSHGAAAPGAAARAIQMLRFTSFCHRCRNSGNG